MEITGNIGHDTTFIGSIRVAKICNFQQLLVPLYEKRYVLVQREREDRQEFRAIGQQRRTLVEYSHGDPTMTG